MGGARLATTTVEDRTRGRRVGRRRATQRHGPAHLGHHGLPGRDGPRVGAGTGSRVCVSSVPPKNRA
jgi:hypothetical protein